MMKFCSSCAQPVVRQIPEGDSRLRAVCPACGTIHYENPKLVVGTIPVWGDQVLLCRRAIEPRHGYWTLPAGFMENGESVAEGATRETLEEADARIDDLELFTMYSISYVDQVHVYYRARLLDLDFGPGTESLEVSLFREDEIPWDDLAFRTVQMTLREFFADRKAGHFKVHTGSLNPIR
jgi:ADP-ribose pyrophosphatase YjhB (NUDIX family)